MVAGLRVPAPTSVLNGCTIMQPRSVQYVVNASNASCMVSTLITLMSPDFSLRTGVRSAIALALSPVLGHVREVAMVRVHTMLLVVCAVAVLACAGLSVPLLTASAPESCCAAGPAPSPAGSAQATRPAGLPPCLIWSWRVVAQEETLKFYIDAAPLAFTFGSGDRYYEFHPDG